MLPGKLKTLHGRQFPVTYLFPFIILLPVLDPPILLPPHNCLSFLLPVSLVEEPELLEEVANIRKDAAEEAAKIAAAKGQEHVVEGI